jgi:mRNA interferase RelE/StbE
VKYQVRVIPSAEKEMDKLPALIHTRLSRRILSLEDNPRPRGTKKLGGREEYRLRVGDYRVLYTIDDENGVITVFGVGHRREVYR